MINIKVNNQILYKYKQNKKVFKVIQQVKVILQLSLQQQKNNLNKKGEQYKIYLQQIIFNGLKSLKF